MPNPKLAKEATDDILSQISVDEEDFDQLGDNQPDPEDEDENQPEVDDNDNDEDATDPVDDGGDQEEEIDLKQKLKEDKHGNLLDNKGRIVAKAGKERGIVQKLKKRLIEEEATTQRQARMLAEVSSGARELMEKYKALRDERTQGQALGLDAAEQKEALEIFAMSKLDPKGALRKILTKYHLNGNDLSDLGVTGPLDPAEVAKHILQQQNAEKEKAKPATEPVEPPEQKEAKQLFENHPELLKAPESILSAITDAKNCFPHKSLEEIWVALKTHLQKQKQQKPQNRQQEERKARDVPRNGSTSRKPATKGIDTSARSPTSSFEDIGRELLADLKRIEEKG